MNTEWSLDALYESYESEAFQNDLKKVDEVINKLKEQSETLKNKTSLINFIHTLEEFAVLTGKLGNYINLKITVNTTDAVSNSYLSKLETKMSEKAKPLTKFEKFVSEIKDLDAWIESDETLKAYEFMLHETRDAAKYLLSDDVEEVITKMNLSAGSAWEQMHSYLTSTVKVDYRGEVINLPGVRNLAYSSDPKVRKDAYEAEIACYDKIKDSIAFSLNNIKQQVNTICELRGYDSPLDACLIQSRMKKETLDAMWDAIRDSLPKFQSYLKHKAKLLGYENGLPWYELFAPMGTNSKEYTIEEAKDYLLKHFRPFADDMADMMETAFDEAWIDFYPHMGKVGGAFCCNLPFIKQSRVLTNYDGALGDIQTLAHELGHAYHGMMIEDHLPLNTDYTMPVAETASTFNETVIMNAAIEEADDQEKLVLIENMLQDLTQTICDIYSRYLFETSVFEQNKEGFIYAEQLEKLMLDAQKKAFGDAIDPNYLHPYMWVNKGHYYSADLSFYNFPYAFGNLFARGLYEQYLEEGKAFNDKYRALLKATTVSSVEDVAMMANIDVTKKDFWAKSLKGIEELIDQYISLTSK